MAGFGRCCSARWPCTSRRTADARVAVIPFDRDHRGGPILVGVDGSAHGAAAVGYAFEEAAVRGTGVVAVLAHDSLARPRFARHPATFDESDSQEHHAIVSEQFAGWGGQVSGCSGAPRDFPWPSRGLPGGLRRVRHSSSSRS
jgi:hypothetical protein